MKMAARLIADPEVGAGPGGKKKEENEKTPLEAKQKINKVCVLILPLMGPALVNKQALFICVRA